MHFNILAPRVGPHCKEDLSDCSCPLFRTVHAPAARLPVAWHVWVGVARTMRGRLRGVASDDGCCSQTPSSDGTKTFDEPLRMDGGISALPLPLAMDPSNPVLL